MGNKMSQKSRKELATQIQPRYLKSGKLEKGRILTEFVENSGYNRKLAIRLLHSDLRQKAYKKKPGRRRKYTEGIIHKIERLYEISDYLCGQRLKPFLPELIEKLESCHEMYFTSEEKQLLSSMSSATINRSLSAYRKSHNGKGKTLTKPGSLIKQQIAVRTGMDWDDHRPGFLEIDLVAHCGRSASGPFFYSLTVTDICLGWTENVILRRKSKEDVVQAMYSIEKRMPFPILGIDSDNGSEFINDLLFGFCSDRENKIMFTRSRPYHKNDQAHVEQKNWAVVRKLLGYHRFDTPNQFDLISRIFELNHIYNNFFQPVRKTILSPQRTDNALSPKYDIARTPYRRALSSPFIDIKNKLSIMSTYISSNPVTLIAEIRRLVLLLNDSSSYE